MKFKGKGTVALNTYLHIGPTECPGSGNGTC